MYDYLYILVSISGVPSIFYSITIMILNCTFNDIFLIISNRILNNEQCKTEMEMESIFN